MQTLDPMSVHCFSLLLVKGDEEDVYRWVEKAAAFDNPDGDNRPLNFEAIVSPPPITCPLEMINWRYDNWGTREEPELKNFLRQEGLAEYQFETFLSPPIRWLEAAAAQNPELSFTLSYIDRVAETLTFEKGALLSREEITPQEFYGH